MLYEIKRAMALGSKYGLKGVRMYCDPSVNTPEVDESAISGAVATVVTLAAVIIGLYITGIVTGSMSKAVGTYNSTSGLYEGSGLGMSAAWNSTFRSIDTQGQSSFNLAGIMPIAIVGTGILVIIISAFSMQ